MTAGPMSDQVWPLMTAEGDKAVRLGESWKKSFWLATGTKSSPSFETATVAVEPA